MSVYDLEPGVSLLNIWETDFHSVRDKIIATCTTMSNHILADYLWGMISDDHYHLIKLGSASQIL